MIQSSTTEFREAVTGDFLKTVSAFANGGGGEIIFGMDNSCQVKGLSDARQDCLNIETSILDYITPEPDYTLELQNRNRTIRLTVKGGKQKPYLYQSKAYTRNESRTTEADTLELSRLILEGKHLAFEELSCEAQNLSFEILGGKLKESIQIENMNQDILKVLNLYSDRTGYNNAAGILADQGHFPGIDLVKFGEDTNIIERRVTLDHTSVLSVCEKVMEIFRTYYQYEVIQGLFAAKQLSINI